jgi:excisionase family DNA binding protein
VSRRRKQTRPPSRRAPVGWEHAESLSITEAANVLGISRSRAYAWAEDGRLPVTTDHLGDHRVTPSALKTLLSHRQGRQEPLPFHAGPTFGPAWLKAVQADPALKHDHEALAVAAWLAEHADDQGHLDAEATAFLDRAGVAS